MQTPAVLPVSDLDATTAPAPGAAALPAPESQTADSPAQSNTSPKRGVYGDEPPDHKNYRYGYPPFSGRMFGSGN